MSIQHDDAPARGTINNIPITVSPILKFAASPSTEHSDKDSILLDTQESLPCVILLYSGTTVDKSYDDLIQASLDDTPPSNSPRNSAALEGIPHFLCHDSKVTMDHKGGFHMGYINSSPESGFQFIFISNTRSRKVDFSIPLPYFKQHWTTLLVDDRFYWPFHSQIIPKISNILQKSPLNQLCIFQMSSLPMSTLSLQSSGSLQTQPTSLAKSVQQGEMRSY